METGIKAEDEVEQLIMLGEKVVKVFEEKELMDFEDVPEEFKGKIIWILFNYEKLTVRLFIYFKLILLSLSTSWSRNSFFFFNFIHFLFNDFRSAHGHPDDRPSPTSLRYYHGQKGHPQAPFELTD